MCQNTPAFLISRKGENQMPYRPKVPCKQPGCAALVEPGKQYCEKHLPLHPEVTRSAGRRGYGSRWQRESKQFLQSHPLCAECMKQSSSHRSTARSRRPWNSWRTSGTKARAKATAEPAITTEAGTQCAICTAFSTDTGPSNSGVSSTIHRTTES